MNNNLLRICLLSTVVFLTVLVSGQSLQLSDSNTVIPNGSEITILRNPVHAEEIPCALFVTNTSQSDIEVNVMREDISIVDSTTNYFCWEVCYPPFVDSGFYTRLVSKGQTDSTFIAHYAYETKPGVFKQGTSKVKYTFFNVWEPTDAVSVTVNYICGYDGVDEYYARMISTAMPNPADDKTEISYNLPAGISNAYLSLSSISGVELQRIELGGQSGKATFNFSALPSGVYLYSLVVDHKMGFSRKLIIQH